MLHSAVRPNCLERRTCACTCCTCATVVLVPCICTSCVFLVKNVLRSCACVRLSLVPWCRRAVRLQASDVQRARHAANCVRAVQAVYWCNCGYDVPCWLPIHWRETCAMQGESVVSAGAVQSKRAVTRGVQDPGLCAGPAPPDSVCSPGPDPLD